MSLPLDLLRDALRDRLQLDRELGRGGMGTVYLAQDLRHHCPVAVKILNPAISAELGAERFEREIEIVARLSHPHIVPLIDSGEIDDIRFFVMPLIEGESLRARLRDEPRLPIDEAIRITRQIADALAYAGASGIVHRDIKPENILLSHGHAFLSDFGIARAAIEAGGAAITASGLALGTPAYASPEQLLADRTLDARSDIYSLGCVLFEMLAGEPPFGTGSAHTILARQLTGAPPSLGAFRSEAPRWVEAVIQRATAQAAADRFATAKELAEALDSRMN